MDLPDTLPGLDIKQALSHINNKYELYLKLLGLFKKNHSQDVLSLSNLIEQQDWDQAQIVAHTLKGVAGNIGATDIFITCQSIDRKLKDKEHDLLVEVQHLRENFSKTLESIDELMELAQS